MNPKFPVLALVASFALCFAGCAADTDDENDDVDEGPVAEMNEAIAVSYTGAFHSPTGKNYCYVSTYDGIDSVRCEWRGGGDHAMFLEEGKRARRINVTDTVFAANGKTLQYGQVIKHGDLRCTVDKVTGINCKSVKSGHGFRVSVEKQTTF